MFSSKSELWETPQDLFDKLDQEFGFSLDVCATQENAKCQKFYTPEQDGLKCLGKAPCGAIHHMAAKSGSGCGERYLHQRREIRL